MNPFSFIITTLISLYVMVVLLRVWLQLTRADFYNPFSQFVVKATQPIVSPLRRFIPSIGSVDTATLLLAYILCTIKVSTALLFKGYSLNSIFLIFGAISLVKSIGMLIFWVLLLRAILSWVSQGRSPIEYVFVQLTEPLAAPIRRVLPPVGGLDLSVLVLFLGLQFLNVFMNYYVPFWGMQEL